ncbi:MATE family efflux transporter [Croceimicrobium sp.]|uniref:MATE family efflux transporter n=1 Tax=Croceimicrobium sp. TaxID=2828340 RepID=UPI003BAD3B07
MTYKEHFRKNIELAWPVMLGQIGHVMVGLADSIMVGALGTVALAAGAFANSVFVVPMVFGIGLAFGLTTPVANADGEKKPEKARSYLKHGIYLNTGIALLIFFLLLGLEHFLHYMGQEQEVLDTARPYYRIICLSLVPLLTFLTFKQFAEGLSDTRMAMLISLGANLLNIGLNYLLIYGHFGFPAMGLAGAGLATLIARIIMALTMAIYVFRKPAFKVYTQGIQWAQTQWSHFKKLLDIGVPSGLQFIFEVSAFAIAAVMAGWIGAESLAAHQIAISLASVSYMAASGIGAAANVRVSNQLGAGNIPALRMAAHTNFALMLILMSIAGLVFFFGRHLLPTFYSNDPVVIDLAAQLLIVAVAFQLFDGMQVAVLAALRGLSETRIPTLIVMFSYWVIALGSSYYMGFELEWGPLGIWYGLALGLIVASSLLTWRFEIKSKQLLALHHAEKHQL